MGILRQLPDRNIRWHSTSVKKVLSLVSTNQVTGLTHAEAQKRLEIFGPNSLPRAKQMNPILRFLSQFKNVISILLIVITIFCFAVGDIVYTFFIFL